jgi:hypothetical protein
VEKFFVFPQKKLSLLAQLVYNREDVRGGGKEAAPTGRSTTGGKRL